MKQAGRSRVRWLGSLTVATLATAAVSGCDAIDPTNVQNPTTTDDDLAQASNPTRALLPGLRAQFARMTSAYVVATEVISDNYSIHGTGLVVDLDDPTEVMPALVNGTGTSASGVYWNVQELRALADFVIDEVAPDDETATPALLAEAHYYRAMAFLTLGEVFSMAPHEEDGAMQSARVALNRAVTEFGAAAAFGAQAQAGLARAHRLLGDRAAAVAAANSALSASPTLLFAQGYDENTLTNTAVAFLVLRALQEMQPLPRLDFLDPKYTGRESSIPIATAEEMHLILAEAALADGDATTASSALATAIRVAKGRGEIEFDDTDERRDAKLRRRPSSKELLVRADAESPYRAGLVLDRPADGVIVHPVSATSLSADSIGALTDTDELWHALWLARQEIMFLEGRRLADLGIKLPIMQREIDQNPNINAGDPGTVPLVPAYIPVSPRYAMDLYSPIALYEGEKVGVAPLTTMVTIGVDMNKVLTTNNASPFR